MHLPFEPCISIIYCSMLLSKVVLILHRLVFQDLWPVCQEIHFIFVYFNFLASDCPLSFCLFHSIIGFLNTASYYRCIKTWLFTILLLKFNIITIVLHFCFSMNQVISLIPVRVSLVTPAALSTLPSPSLAISIINQSWA